MSLGWKGGLTLTKIETGEGLGLGLDLDLDLDLQKGDLNAFLSNRSQMG